MTDSDESTVPRHPIGVVSDRTRLSQDVLRVWERRYRVVEPGRSTSGQRLYSDADIERLRLLGVATQTGRTIGQVAGMPTPDLARMVHEDEEARSPAGDHEHGAEPANDLIAPALERAIALDGPGLDSLLRRAMLGIGMPSFLDTVATPLLTRIGDEWHAGRLAPSHEHLATAVIQRVITAAMDTVTAGPGAPNIVVATLAGERHEIGAMLVAAAAAAEGWRVTYLGADLPAGDIADAAIRTTAQAVGLSIIHVADPRHVIEEIRLLRGRLPAAIPLFIGGAASASLAGEISGSGVRLLRDLGELRQALRGDPVTASRSDLRQGLIE